MLESISTRGYIALAACGVVGAIIGVAAGRTPHPARAPMIAIASSAEAAPIHAVTAIEQPPAVPDTIAFAFQAGNDTYLALETVSELPKHGKPELVADDYISAAIASLREVPAADRVWEGREVIVDGTCHARVVGFALVGRVTGDPGYANEEHDITWTPAQIFEHGNVTIAAKLDRCTGTYARLAGAPAIRPFTLAENDDDAVEAETRMRDSSFGADAAKQWVDFKMDGQWDSAMTAQTWRDPDRGTLWITVHAHSQEQCGGIDVNAWGLFRVESNGSLTTVQLRNLGDLEQVDHLVDVDGDGVPELVGRGWITPDAAIESASGTTIGSLSVPFYGCPC